MGQKRKDRINLFKLGNSLQEIAEQTDTDLKAVLAALDWGVLKGEFKSSDILFAVDESTREVVTDVMKNNDTVEWLHTNTVKKLLKLCSAAGNSINEDDLTVILRYYSKHFRFGDLYEDMRTIETALHSYVKRTLKDIYGPDKWFDKIPSVRRDAMNELASRKDAAFQHPFQAAHLSTLFQIIECGKTGLRKGFEDSLRQHFDLTRKRVSKARADWFREILAIRNRIMHPVGPVPTDEQFTKTVKFRQFVAASFERNQQ